MKIDLVQKRLSAHYHFEITVNGTDNFIGKANRTMWPFFRKIEIAKPENPSTFTLQQTNYWLKLIEPKWINGCPYLMCEKRNPMGWIRESFKFGQPMANAVYNGVGINSLSIEVMKCPCVLVTIRSDS